MNKSLLCKYSIAIVLMCLALQSSSQNNFHYSAELDAVRSEGFYQIPLTPEVISKLQAGFADIRIVNAADKQIPYLLKTDRPLFSEARFISMPIISYKKETDKQTHVVIENKTKATLSELVLIIKNADASRTISLSGSDDKKQWFVIKENIFLNNLFTTADDRFVQALAFPPSKYAFFKIIIHGENVLPVNISNVGVYEQGLINGKFISVPAPIIFQKDSSDNYSYATLRFNEPYLIDRLELQVSGNKFFKRRIDIYSNDDLINAQKPLYISSNEPMVFPVAVRTNQLLIKVQNDDNPPLKITAASAFQLNRYLAAWLDSGTNYRIVFGDSLALPPRYDLEFFKDSIRSILPLTYKKIEKNKGSDKKSDNSFFEDKKWMWLIIILVLTVLLFFTVRMVKEVNRKQ